MVHRRILELLKQHKYVSAGGFTVLSVLALAALAPIFSQGSISSHNYEPRFGDCPFNRETGDIQGTCGDKRGNMRGVMGDVYGAYKDGEPVPKYFWIRIDEISVPVNDDYDEKAPQFWWLYKNGYLTDEGREEIQEGDFPDDADIPYGDLKWNSEVRKGLEAGTVCQAKIKPEATSEVWVETTQESQSYNDEPDDADERHVNHIVPNPKIVEAEDIRITERYMACKFDFTKVMNKGMELDGFFKVWNGAEPVIGGDDSDEGWTRFQIDFGMDMDQDGVLKPNDECPETQGLKEKNGCPNQVSKILSVDGPRNVTVGEQVNYSVQVRNPDDDSTKISWSNGVNGETAVYRFNSTGNYTISVTADDGFEEDTEDIRVKVTEKSIIGSIFDFFSSVWEFLSYGG